MPEVPHRMSLPTNTGQPNLPTLEEIASYNVMNAYQRQLQREQLQNTDNSPLRDYAVENQHVGTPWPPLSDRWESRNNIAQERPQIAVPLLRAAQLAAHWRRLLPRRNRLPYQRKAYNI